MVEEGWERRQLPVLFFQIFFFLLAVPCHAAATSYAVSPVTRLNVRHGIGQLQLQMAKAGHFFGARAGLQLTCPAQALVRGTRRRWRGSWQKKAPAASLTVISGCRAFAANKRNRPQYVMPRPIRGGAQKKSAAAIPSHWDFSDRV